MLPGNKNFVNNKLQWKLKIKIAFKIYNKSKKDFEFKKYCKKNLEFIKISYNLKKQKFFYDFFF